MGIYHGYVGDVNYDSEGKYYYGQIQNISAAVGYDGNNLLELEEDFHTAVDDYIILIS